MSCAAIIGMVELRDRATAWLVVVLLGLGSLCASCVTSRSGVRVFVDHQSALVDTPLDISIRGAELMASVTIRLTAIDVRGAWQERQVHYDLPEPKSASLHH
jgi:hypothetical protein